ncbi:MAG: protein TolR [Legionellales bacterium]|nr:protein TolR [Legionellales bacterium]|tara:strand:- start:1707 stop:2150 length:444 start_codon:yes stop_codon:yes gene_type:complete
MARSRKRLLAEINVVPYIDVMLVLLIIFMVTTPLLSQGVKINLPQAQAEALSTKEDIPLIISVDAKGAYYLNVTDTPDVPMSPDALATRVAAEVQIAKQQHHPRMVLVKGDNDVDYGKVVQAMVLLQQSGVENIGLMTKEPARTRHG